MIDDAERLDAAINRRRIGAGLEGVSPAVRTLVEMAGEVADSFGQFRLSAADHDRLYADSLLKLEAAMRRQGHVWNRVHVGRRGAAALIGGAAATAVTALAIGIAVHERHKHRSRRLGLAAA